MQIVIIANGEPPTRADIDRWLGPADTLICADGGARAALGFGLQPHHAIGDFDSVSEDELQQLGALGTQLHRHPPAKDETDLELALTFAATHFHTTREIIVMGAMGGRIDHELANMMLLAMPVLQDRRVVISHSPNQISLIDARRNPSSSTVQGKAGDVVSLIPFGGDAQGVRTKGLQYPLRDEPLLFGPARGVSNMLLGSTAIIHVQAGMVLCVHTST
jgi:thiamine pyrophosphokinase